MKSHEQEQADLLDAYWTALRQDSGVELPSELDPEIAVIAERLEHHLRPPQPEDVFVARLGRRLEAQAKTVSPHRNRHASGDTRQWPALLLGNPRRWWSPAAAFVLVILIVALGSWERLGSKQIRYLPSLLRVASAAAGQTGEDLQAGRSYLGAVTFYLVEGLPPVPDGAMVYRQRQEPLDEAGARALAERLGITVAEVTEIPDADVFTISGKEGGRLVVSRAFRGYFTFHASPPSGFGSLAPVPPQPRIAPPNATVTALDAEEVEQIARRYLEERALLGFSHVVDTSADVSSGVTPLFQEVTFLPTVDGRPVQGLGITVTVDQSGEVTAVHSKLVQLEAVEAYPLLSPEEAYRRLQDKQPDLFQAWVQTASGMRAVGSSLSGYERQRPLVMPERAPLVNGEAAVERVALEYYAVAAAPLEPVFQVSDRDPLLLVQPVYVFSGSFQQGQGFFEAFVQAARPEYVE